MVINPTLGLFVPRKRLHERENRIQPGAAGGLWHSEWSDFIFGCPPRRPPKGLAGGQDEGTTPNLIESQSVQYGGFTGRSFEEALLNPFAFSSFRNLFVMYCSFVDGLDRGLRLPIIYLLKTKYLLSQAVAFTAFGISLSPWLAKPFVAVVTDTVPIFGLRRKPYVIGSAWVNGISLGAIGAASAVDFGGYMFTMSLMTLRTICRCVTGSVVQGMLLEDCAEGGQTETSAQISYYHTSHRLGQFMSVLASGALLSTNSFLTVFLGIASFHMGSILLATMLDEAPQTPEAELASSQITISSKLENLLEIVANEPGFSPLLEYAFWAMACPGYEARMAYYLLDVRHLSVSELSLVSTAQTVASLVTPSVYNVFFSSKPLPPLLTTFTVSTVPAALLPLFLTTGLSDTLSLNPVMVAAASGFFLTTMNSLQMMPANVMVARMARKGFEGSMFSVFTVTEGVGRVMSEFYVGLVPVAMGAAAWNGYMTMSAYIGLSGLFQLTPLVAVSRIPPQLEDTETGSPKRRDSLDTLETLEIDYEEF